MGDLGRIELWSCERASREGFPFFYFVRLVIELFIVALILVDCFMSLFHHYHMYSAIVILSAVIPSSL